MGKLKMVDTKESKPCFFSGKPAPIDFWIEEPPNFIESVMADDVTLVPN
jgi:hypothetical protein